jgi:hypothetical protein
MDNVLQNNPFDVFWRPETVELAWHLASRWIDGIKAVDDENLASLLAETTKRSTDAS